MRHRLLTAAGRQSVRDADAARERFSGLPGTRLRCEAFPDWRGKKVGSVTDIQGEVLLTHRHGMVTAARSLRMA